LIQRGFHRQRKGIGLIMLAGRDGGDHSGLRRGVLPGGLNIREL
jgi:hypothetical protein